MGVSIELVEALRDEISKDDKPCVRARDRLIVTLIAIIGFRQQDIWGACWWQLIDEKGQVRSRAIIPRKRDDASARKSRSAEREPRLWPPIRQEIREYYLLMGRPALDSPVVTNREGGRLNRNNWQRDHWRPALARLKAKDRWSTLGPLSPHMLRRCVATMMGYALLPDFVALEQIGHNQREKKTLMRHYLRALGDAEERQAVGVPVAEQIEKARTKATPKAKRKRRAA
jgi:integrase